VDVDGIRTRSPVLQREYILSSFLWHLDLETCRFGEKYRSREGSMQGKVVAQSRYWGWVDVGWVKKILRFWQKLPLNCDSMGVPPYPLPQLDDGWVRCEG
jgi:hypothetical protein